MIEYTEEIAGILGVKLYDARSCCLILERAKHDEAWTEAQVSAPVESGFNPAARPESRRASVLAPQSQSAIKREFDETMDDVIKPLVKKVWNVSIKQHSETHFVRYSPGNYYRAHSDTGSQFNDRYFTVVVYLNDDFEGGHTSFPQLKYSVAPQCGKAVIFPATYLHCAEPVTDGEKYVLVSWLTGPPPVRWI